MERTYEKKWQQSVRDTLNGIMICNLDERTRQNCSSQWSNQNPRQRVFELRVGSVPLVKSWLSFLQWRDGQEATGTDSVALS
jgi:hypothetical protein